MAEREVDVLIIGGGLIGALLSHALANSKYKTLLIDSNPFSMKLEDGFDSRSLALSPASIRILTMLDIWSALLPFAAPINTIHVSEQGRFGTTRINQKNSEALGYVVEMQHLYRAIMPCIETQSILAPAEVIKIDEINHQVTLKTTDNEALIVKAGLIVAADGADSFVRKAVGLTAQTKDYKQCALVANIGLSRSHNGKAYERFSSLGPLALLPMINNRSSLVWSLPTPEAKRMLGLTDENFLKTLHESFGYRLGKFAKIGKRILFPLRQVTMKQTIKEFIVFIGNAAHTLHPIAGQGFNLGLRDVALLAQIIMRHGNTAEALAIFQTSRRYDQNAIAYFTDGLIELFASKVPGLSVARGCGLLALDNLPPLKHLLARHASGFSGVVPDLVCQIPLSE